MEAFTDIENLYKDRGWTSFNPIKEFLKLEEVLMEFFEGHTDENELLMVESLCEMITVSVSALANMGYDPTKTLSNHIASQLSVKGAINPQTGKWSRDLNQPASEIILSDYQSCRRT